MSASRSFAAVCVFALLAAPHTAPAQSRPSGADTTIQYSADGITVIHHRRGPLSSVVAVELYLLGGARQVSAANAGIEPFVLMASEYGTRKYPGTATRRALAETGSSITVETTPDWTTFSFHGLKQEFDSTWAVFADRLMQPALDSTAMRIVRSHMLDAVAQRTVSPEVHAWIAAESLAYRGHPYAVETSGTEASLRALTADDLRSYARDHFVKSRMLLVVVGDLAPETVQQAIARTLGQLPQGEYKWTLPPPLARTKPELVTVSRAIPTNYIVGYFAGPSRSHRDYPAFHRAMMLLSNVISYEVREVNALSYAAYVDVADHGATSAAIYVSTTRPDTTMRVVQEVLTNFERELRLPRYVLRKASEALNAYYVSRTEYASSHAGMLARAHLYDGDFRAAARYAEIMSNLASADLRQAVRTYARNIQFVVVGDPELVTPAQFTKR